jgi:uncharacterized protein (TIGR02246 family)
MDTASERMIALFEQRLQRLEDIEDIRTLRMRYHAYVNDGPHDRFESLFTPDAVVELGTGSRFAGRQQIRQGFIDMFDSVPFLKQFIHNHIIEPEGDRATGRSTFEAKYGTADGQSLAVAGRYDEIYARCDGVWYIHHLKMDLYMAVPHDQGWGGPERITI